MRRGLPTRAPARPACLRLAGLAGFVALAGLAGLPACRPAAAPAAEVAVAWEVSPRPPRRGPAEIRLALTERATGRPAAGAAVTVEGNMTHPGMQPVFATAREVAPGRYVAALDFSMAGDWIVTVAAELPGGRKVEERIEVPGVEG